MALPLKSGADLYTQELLRARLHNFDGDLAEYGTGSIYFNTTSGLNTSDRIRYRGLTNWHSVANLEDIARLEEMIGNLDFAGSEDFIGITSRVAALEGNFTNGAAKDAVKFGGQLPSYYATQSAFSALQEKVNAFLDGDVDSDAVLENLKEIQAFLDSYDGATSLVDLLDAKADKSQLSGYLSLSGGTLTGVLYIEGGYDSKLIFNNTDTDTNYNQILFQQDGSLYGVLGTNMDGVLHWNYSPLLHAGNIRDYAFTAQAQITNNTDADTLLTNGVYLNATGNGSGNSNFPSTYGILMTFTQDKNYSAQISVGNNSMHVRRKIDAWSDWKTVAFTDSNITGNAASATKLATARTIWGQSFDGTADVTGDLYYKGNTFIYLGDDFTSFGHTTRGTYIDGKGIFFNASGSTNMVINSSGNVSIASWDYADTKYRFAVGDGRTIISAYNNSSPTLGNMATSALLVGSSNYGVQHWITGDGYGHIQVGRFDGTANAYHLILQELGGYVGIGTPIPQEKLHVAGNILLRNYDSIRFFKTDGTTQVELLTLNSDNEAVLGGDANHYGLNTIVKGYRTIIKTGTYNNSALIIDENCNAAIPYRLLVGNPTDSGWIPFQVKGAADIDGPLYISAYTKEGIYLNEVGIHWHNTSAGWVSALVEFSSSAVRLSKPTTVAGDLHVEGNIIADGQVSSGGVAEEGTGVSGSLERVTFTIPSGTTSFECEHNLGTKEISVSIYEEGGDYQQILADVYLDSTNIARIVFGRATDVAHKVVIIG